VQTRAVFSIMSAPSPLDTAVQFAYKGLHVTLGAIATAGDTLQNPQQRSRWLDQLNTEFARRSREWEERGARAEREARDYLETVLQQYAPGSSSEPARPPAGTRARSTPASAPAPAAGEGEPAPSDLQQLTREVVELRAELERQRQQSK